VTLFVTGTGTEVGKTVASAVLLARYGAELPLGYWKPVATGSSEPEERDVDAVRRLAGHRCQVAPELYLFGPPLSPHLAARLDGARIDPALLAAELLRLGRDPERAWVVEGAGGLHVPLTDEGHLLSDLLREVAIPCLLVARSGLGTINHTLLSLEALRARGIAVAGVVLNGPSNPENRRAIESFGRVAVVGEVEPIAPLDREGVAAAASRFDPDGLLARYLKLEGA
jgi:malonyl-CoA O-methyltransferase